VYSSAYPPAASIELVQSQPLLQKLAWAVIVVALFGLLATAKQALDERASELVEQFAKLDGMNKDMRALFAKLRGEVEAQLQTYNPCPK
jgi:hypothetical protein